MGALLKALFLPFKLLAWVVTFPIRVVTGPFKLMIAILLLALLIAGIQLVLFDQFFTD